MKLCEKLIVLTSLALAVSICSLAMRVCIPTADAAMTYPVQEITLPIAMYHHILKEDDRLNKYTISPEEFKGDLQYLKEQGYQFILMQDLIDYVYQGVALPEKPVMITFDDGYESFYEYAYPILQEMDAKAVFSIVGKYADLYSQTSDHHVRYSHATWEQMQEMVISGRVEIQNHSYNMHVNENGRHGAKKIPGEDNAHYRQVLIDDIGALQQEFFDKLGFYPTVFTYPFGQISPEALPVIKELGFTGALVCRERLNYLTGDPEELYHLNRFNRPHGVSLQSILEKAYKADENKKAKS